MNDPDYFFLIILGTIVTIRFLLFVRHLFFYHIKTPTLRGFRIHHYMYGIALAIIAVLIQNLTLYAIGFGLFIDEFLLVLIKGLGTKYEDWRESKDYYSKWSLLGALFFAVLVFLFREVISELA